MKYSVDGGQTFVELPEGIRLYEDTEIGQLEFNFTDEGLIIDLTQGIHNVGTSSQTFEEIWQDRFDGLPLDMLVSLDMDRQDLVEACNGFADRLRVMKDVQTLTNLFNGVDADADNLSDDRLSYIFDTYIGKHSK